MSAVATRWNIVEDSFTQGKADAWAGRSKSPPEEDVVAASLYDLGFSEGVIKRSPLSEVLPRGENSQTQPHCD
jgi:hypothetical protein